MTEAELDPPFMTDRVKGMDGEAPACQPPTTAPSPHRVSVDVAECADMCCTRATCTAGWCKWARAVVPWRGGSAPLKRAALRQCLAQRCGGDSHPLPLKGGSHCGGPEPKTRVAKHRVAGCAHLVGGNGALVHVYINVGLVNTVGF